jgi:hypothetical protein
MKESELIIATGVENSMYVMSNYHRRESSIPNKSY